MKIITVFLTAMIIGVAAQSQIVPCSDSEIKELPKKGFLEHNQWYQVRTEKGDGIVMYFDLTTVGAKKAIEKAIDILKDNSLDFDSARLDKSYLASYVKDMYDYENLATSCKVGGSIVDKLWVKGKDALSLTLDDEYFKISCYNNIVK